ncbi:MAG TPA: hypothetical protein VFB13_18200 [Reyranella sp.]|jgi:hypothetical protein|nr:hypothetical protein [Reyranella sp.]
MKSSPSHIGHRTEQWSLEINDAPLENVAAEDVLFEIGMILAALLAVASSIGLALRIG